MPKLYYLDDRPIFESDRLAAEAFKVGGQEAEKKAREDFRQKEIQKMKNATQHTYKLDAEARERKKKLMKKMFDDMRNEKNQIMAKRDQMKEEYRTMKECPEKDYLDLKIRKLDADLRMDYYRLLD
jgi:membrane-associated HD superfamily phosphohydrolase